ncbi:MAG: type VI secretion system-associated FHA domain protein TagH [Burkholderiales bacterium]
MLTITVVSYKDLPVDQPISAEFGEAGGTIGRSPDSTLLLPDPERIISRTHAVVECRGGRFFVRDQGSTVAVVVNGRPVGRGHEQALVAGDEVRIAGYALRVEGTAPPAHDVSGDDTTTILREGTFLSWSEDGKAVPQDRIATVIVPSPEPGPGTAPPAPVTGAGAAPAAAPAPDAARAQAPAAPVAVDGDDDLLAALLRGAGVRELAVPGGLTPELMEEVGAVMRETMRGLLDLLAARAHAKQEVRADATIVMSHDNNPLKFAPGLDAAITHLLVPRGEGFMPPLRSLADARESLRTHQEGFVAGMRAALAAVLARFDPAKLEQRLSESEGSGSLLPMTHKAKLWSHYEALYGEISREAETDFHFLFGEEFLRAYHAKTRPQGSRGETPDPA